MHGMQAGLVLACVLVGCTGRDAAVVAPTPDGEATGLPQPRVPQHDVPPPASPTTGVASTPAGTSAATGKRMDARLDGFGPLTLGMEMTAAGQAWPGLFDSLPRMAEGVCFNANPGGVDAAVFQRDVR